MMPGATPPIAGTSKIARLRSCRELALCQWREVPCLDCPHRHYAPPAPGQATPLELQQDDAGSEPVLCGFCPNDACCEANPGGGQRERAGMMCCWGTTC